MDPFTLHLPRLVGLLNFTRQRLPTRVDLPLRCYVWTFNTTAPALCYPAFTGCERVSTYRLIVTPTHIYKHFLPSHGLPPSLPSRFGRCPLDYLRYGTAPPRYGLRCPVIVTPTDSRRLPIYVGFTQLDWRTPALARYSPPHVGCCPIVPVDLG